MKTCTLYLIVWLLLSSLKWSANVIDGEEMLEDGKQNCNNLEISSILDAGGTAGSVSAESAIDFDPLSKHIRRNRYRS